MKIKLIVTIETDSVEGVDDNKVAKTFAELFHHGGDLIAELDGKELIAISQDAEVIEIDGFAPREE